MKESPIHNIESHNTKLIEFFGMSDDQVRLFEQRVENHSGLVRVFIHPLFPPSDADPRRRVFNVYGRVLTSPKSPPILAFEDISTIDAAMKFYDTVQDVLPNEVYMVPTLKRYPYPIMPGKPYPTDRDSEGKLFDKDIEYIDESIKYLLKHLYSLGVRKMLVGGTYLSIVDVNLTQCVGNFLEIVRWYLDKSDMDLKVSMGTAPLNRNDLRDIRPDFV